MPTLPSGPLDGDGHQQLLELLQVFSVRSDLARKTTTAGAQRRRASGGVARSSRAAMDSIFLDATIPPAMTATVQRQHWNGEPTYLGDLFIVSRARGDNTLSAVCKLWTHALGWEVSLEINGDLQRSEVLRSQDDVLAAGETWKAAMVEQGWDDGSEVS